MAKRRRQQDTHIVKRLYPVDPIQRFSEMERRIKAVEMNETYGNISRQEARELIRKIRQEY